VTEPAAPDDAPAPAGAAADRGPVLQGNALALRLARLHLRMGSLALARAELESFAGAGTLDEAALVDLAEVRWRTGDLAGAGEAARAALGRGVEDPLASVIAAEAIAAMGRPAEAKRLANHALEGMDVTLDTLFAGMPRSAIWPGDPEPDVLPSAVRAREDEDRSPASAAAAEAFAGGRGALAAGDIPTAALRLSVAIRLEPKFAQGVLTAIGDRATVPLLALVAGDALRLLGREHDALEAYDTARGKPRNADAATGPSWSEDDEA
jgi:tetratricopeptide (TPR) repeat protein